MFMLLPNIGRKKTNFHFQKTKNPPVTAGDLHTQVKGKLTNLLQHNILERLFLTHIL